MPFKDNAINAGESEVSAPKDDLLYRGVEEYLRAHQAHSVLLHATEIKGVLNGRVSHTIVVATRSQTVYNTKETRTHTHRELIRKWLWEPKGSSLEYI